MPVTITVIGEVTIGDDLVRIVIDDYTREAGVRRLEQRLDRVALCRAVRAHANTLEWLPIFLPSLWLCHIFWLPQDPSGAIVAAIGRLVHTRDMALLEADTRARLKARMVARQYDEVVTIRRDSITGRGSYSDTITDMHFGRGQVCATVTRARWTDAMLERGLVYCEGPECIIVPTVCRNVSRIRRLEAKPAAVAPSGAANVASSAREAEVVQPLSPWQTVSWMLSPLCVPERHAA